MNQIDLNNKTAVITGGAQGFGYSMVERFAKSGAKVVIWDKDKDLIDNLDLPNNVSAVQTDVTSYDSVENSVNETIEKNNVSSDKFEFQVLYGVPMGNKLDKLKQKGYKIRIYVPFGEAWFEYSVRRLKENPKIISYVLRNLFKK